MSIRAYTSPAPSEHRLRFSETSILRLLGVQNACLECEQDRAGGAFRWIFGNEIPMNVTTYAVSDVRAALGVKCGIVGGPIPKSKEGDMVIYYPGYTMVQLAGTPGGAQFLWKTDRTWLGEEGWRHYAPGYYSLIFRVPGTAGLNWDQQIAHIKKTLPDWTPMPLSLLTTALLVHLAKTGLDPLEGHVCRTEESVPDDSCGAVWVAPPPNSLIMDGGDPMHSAHERHWMGACKELC